MALGSWSPVRMRAATEESAISQALMVVGAAREEISVEVIERSEKGVTVRISPRLEDETPPIEPESAQQVEDIKVQESDALASEADDEAPELASEEVIEKVETSQDAESVAADDAPSPQQITEDETALEPVLFDAESLEEPAQESQEVAIPDASDYAPSLVAEDARQRARAMAQEFLDRMGLQANAGLSERPFSAIEAGDPDAEQRVYVTVDGPDVSILIGKHGATLKSFQYLLNLTLNNRTDSAGTAAEDAVRVVVDAGNYRSRRAEMLERMATETAERARRESRTIRMEAMPAHERRLVHMFLRDDTSIATSSEGREPHRFVVVMPTDQPHAASRSANHGSREGGGRGYGGNRRGRR